MRNPTLRADRSYAFFDSAYVDYFTAFVIEIAQLVSEHFSGPIEPLTENDSERELLLLPNVLAKVQRVMGAVAAEHPDAPEWLREKLSFVLVAWADEFVIRNYREHWREELHGVFERRFRGTNNAGELFFEHIDEISMRGRRDERALAAVYLLALLLGFEGRYFGNRVRDQVDKYIRDLRSLSLETVTPSNIELAEQQSGIRLPIRSVGVWDQKLKFRLTGVVVAVFIFLAVLSFYWTTSVTPLIDRFESQRAALADKPFELRGRTND